WEAALTELGGGSELAGRAKNAVKAFLAMIDGLASAFGGTGNGERGTEEAVPGTLDAAEPASAPVPCSPALPHPRRTDRPRHHPQRPARLLRERQPRQRGDAGGKPGRTGQRG